MIAIIHSAKSRFGLCSSSDTV